jgi:hypothetical protein
MIASVLIDNLLTAPVIAFSIALLATLLGFNVLFPDSLYPILSTFLLLAIGIKGGRALSSTSPSEIWKPLIGAIVLGIITPLVAFYLFKFVSKLDTTNSSALAAHYGSVSAVTFTVLLSTLDTNNISYEEFSAGLLAVVEVIGIVVALLLSKNSSKETRWRAGIVEVVRGKSIAVLIMGLLIGLIVGTERLAPTDSLFIGLFSGILTLFLIELGVIAAERLRDFKTAGVSVLALSIAIPLINGLLGAVIGSLAGMSTGGVAVMATLAGSASYIAAPAAVRVALPNASPGIYVTASLGITFPFNLTIGIPYYIALANWLT